MGTFNEVCGCFHRITCFEKFPEFGDNEEDSKTFPDNNENILEPKDENTKIIKVLMIKEEENDKDYINVKEHIENHFFGTKKEKKNNIIVYKDKRFNLDITSINFNELFLYPKDKYDFILSFLNDRDNNIEIINTFKKNNYIMKKICQKDELLKECQYIESDNLLLTNHFRKEINRILSWDIYNYPASASSISEESQNDINELKNNLINKSTQESILEEYIICPISHEIMKDPVITPYGHTFERDNIVKAIKKDGKCPLTRKKLEIKDLIPNYGLKQIIDNYNKK